MILFYNGKVFSSQGFQSALVVAGEYIIAVGGEELLPDYPEAEKINLEGRLVLPGFNDSHIHLLSYAKEKTYLALHQARRVEDIITMGRKYAQANHGLIIGVGYNEVNFTEPHELSRFDLDLISPTVPVILYRICGHIACCNSIALHQAGIHSVFKVPDGVIDGDSFGHPTGMLREGALALLNPLIKNNSGNNIKGLLRAAIEDLHRFGITSIGSNDINDTDTQSVIRAYSELYNAGELGVRVSQQATVASEKELIELSAVFPKANPYLRLGAVKVFVDGSLGAKTAYLKQNYCNENHRGLLTISEDKLRNIIDLASRYRLPTLIHAIGDAGVELALRVLGENKESILLRSGIVHAQITDRKLLDDFSKKRVCALVQPAFINTDVEFIENRIALSLIETSYAFKTLYDNTITAFGSDCPVESCNPLFGIYCAVNRSNHKKTKFLNSAEKMTVEEAVLAYTLGGAMITGEENIKGKIKKSYYADITVLRDDIFSLPIDKLLDTQVVMTMVGGKIVYHNLV
ncbi:MAG: amidohydrolase [Bacilli bacterium]|nr:amidohydrolase [Bacilli bacterium]